MLTVSAYRADSSSIYLPQKVNIHQLPATRHVPRFTIHASPSFRFPPLYSLPGSPATGPCRWGGYWLLPIPCLSGPWSLIPGPCFFPPPPTHASLVPVFLLPIGYSLFPAFTHPLPFLETPHALL
jgi:hypothetical protein